MTFPSDIPLPCHVKHSRQLRLQEIFSASLRAALLRGVLIALECLGFWLYSTQSLLLDALSSSFDLFATFALMGCMYAAKAPPDRNHPFGHGRLEPLAGLLLSVFLIQTGLYLSWRQIGQLPQQERFVDPRAWLFALAGAALMQLCYYMMRQYAERHKSAALLAEAVHYRLDALNSFVACIALILAALWPTHSGLFDRLGASLIALTMVYLGFHAAKSNLDQILDRKPSADLFEMIRQASKKVPGVLGTEKIRIQHYGPDAHVDIDIEVDPDLEVIRAHTISQLVRRAIQSAWPAVQDVTVHIEPYFEGDHKES